MIPIIQPVPYNVTRVCWSLLKWLSWRCLFRTRTPSHPNNASWGPGWPAMNLTSGLVWKVWSNPYPTLHHCHAPCCQRSLLGFRSVPRWWQDDSQKTNAGWLLAVYLSIHWVVPLPINSGKCMFIGIPQKNAKILMVTITGKGANPMYTWRISQENHF